MADYGGFRKKPTSVLRKDPPTSRDVTGTAFGGKIVGGDPTRRYVGVFAKDETALERYFSEGYQIEKSRQDGPNLTTGITCKDGDPLTWRGNVIMSIPKDEYARQQADRQQTLDNIRNSMRARKDADSRAIRAGGRGIRIEEHEVRIPPPVGTLDGGE